jgi:antirestriction protein ArdC
MIPNHARYIESWLKVLKNDKRILFTATSKAHCCIMDRGMKRSLMGEAIFHSH